MHLVVLNFLAIEFKRFAIQCGMAKAPAKDIGQGLGPVRVTAARVAVFHEERGNAPVVARAEFLKFVKGDFECIGSTPILGNLEFSRALPRVLDLIDINFNRPFDWVHILCVVVDVVPRCLVVQLANHVDLAGRQHEAAVIEIMILGGIDGQVRAWLCWRTRLLLNVLSTYGHNAHESDHHRAQGQPLSSHMVLPFHKKLLRNAHFATGYLTSNWTVSFGFTVTSDSWP